jgi:hypothetical protein
MPLQRFDGVRWQEYVKTFVCPDFQQFGDVVQERILPVFDRITEEADAVANRRYEELLSLPLDPDRWDPGDVAQEAMAHGFAHYEMLTSMRAATLNLYSAALYHLTEQHLVDLPLRILDSYQRGELPMEKVFGWFTGELRLDVKSLPSWSTIDELRLVANVVKHAEGRSVKELEALRQDLFELPQFRGFPGARWVGRRIRKPLLGEDIFIRDEDFKRYHEAAVSFWTELADALPGLSR